MRSPFTMAAVASASMCLWALAACGPECTAEKPECPETKVCDTARQQCVLMSACEQVAELTRAKYVAACAGKDSLCTYCECFNQGLKLETTVDGTSVVFSCVEPASAPGEATTSTSCEGSTKTTAQACLDARQTCIVDPATAVTTAACDATYK